MFLADSAAALHASPDRTKVAACGGALLLLGAGVLTLWWLSPMGQLAAITGIVAVSPAAISWLRNRFDLGEVVHGYMVAYVIYYVFRAFYILANSFDIPDRPDFADTATQATAFTLLGVIAFLAGYYIRPGSRLADKLGRRLRMPDPQRLTRTVFGLFAVGFVCRAVIYARGSYTGFLANQRDVGPIEMTVDFMGVLIDYAFFLAAAHACTPQSSAGFRRIVWLVLLPVTLASVALTGSKLHVLWILAGCAMARHYLKGPLRLGWAVMLAPLALLAIFPLIGAYREAVTRDVDRPLLAQSGPTYEILREDLSDDFLGTVTAMISDRLCGLETLALVVRFTPDALPYQHGKTMLLAPLMAFVPNIAWPGKQQFVARMTPVSGEDFGTLYFGRKDSGTAIAIMQLGELYLNFGWLGIPIGMFCYGVIAGLIYQAFRASGMHPTALLIYLFLYLHLTFIEGWFASLFSNLLKHLVGTTLVAVALQAGGRDHARRV